MNVNGIKQKETVAAGVVYTTETEESMSVVVLMCVSQWKREKKWRKNKEKCDWIWSLIEISIEYIRRISLIFEEWINIDGKYKRYFIQILLFLTTIQYKIKMNFIFNLTENSVVFFANDDV